MQAVQVVQVQNDTLFACRVVECAEEKRKRKPRSKTHGIYCRAKGCSNSNNNCSLSFFGFPHDDRTDAWIAYAGRPELAKLTQEQLRNRKLCAVHFTPDDFINKQRTALKRTAVPSVPRVKAPSRVSSSSDPTGSSTAEDPASDSGAVGEASSPLKDAWKANREEWRVADPKIPKHLPEGEHRGGPNLGVATSALQHMQQKTDISKLVPATPTPSDTTQTIVITYVEPNTANNFVSLDSTSGPTIEADKKVVEKLHDYAKPATSMNENTSNIVTSAMVAAHIINYDRPKLGRPKIRLPPPELLMRKCKYFAATIERLRKQKEDIKYKLQRYIKREKELSLRELEEGVAEGVQRAVFLMDQLQNYKKNSPRWSDTTIRHCAMLSKQLRGGYSMLQSSKVLRLPSMGTLKKYIDQPTEPVVGTTESEVNNSQAPQETGSSGCGRNGLEEQSSMYEQTHDPFSQFISCDAIGVSTVGSMEATIL